MLNATTASYISRCNLLRNDEKRKKGELANFYTLINMITLWQTFNGWRAHTYMHIVHTMLIKASEEQKRVNTEIKTTKLCICAVNVEEYKVNEGNSSSSSSTKENEKTTLNRDDFGSRTIITLCTAKCNHNSIAMVCVYVREQNPFNIPIPSTS